MPNATRETLCKVCGCEAHLQCSVCKRVRYCSLGHQTDHWREHRDTCVPPIEDFVKAGHFNSYYDGALYAFCSAKSAQLGSAYAQSTIEAFLDERMQQVVTMANENDQKCKARTLSVSTMTENRALALQDLAEQLASKCGLTEEQKKHVQEPLAAQQSILADKPLGYICGYAHATLEIMQRMMQRDLSSKRHATIDGAAALAAWTIALEACYERIKVRNGTEK